jgi:hypothetical protein
VIGVPARLDAPDNGTPYRVIFSSSGNGAQVTPAPAPMFKNAAPARRHWGSNGTRAGSDIRKRQRWTRWTKPALADPLQPRLVAGVMCLIVTFEN